MENDELFVKALAFNQKVLTTGTVIRLEGTTFDGEDITGNYVIQKNSMLEMDLVGVRKGAPKRIKIDMEDIESGLKLKLVATNE